MAHKWQRVRWMDSATVDGWQREGAEVEPVICTTVGFLVGETDTSVTYAHTIDEHGSFCGAITIPKVALLA